MTSFESDAYDADELGQYRSISSLAVVAFLLGLASALMFVGPMLVVVPLAAVAVALLALKGIAASEGGLSGAKLARWGLAMAIAFSVASYSRVQVRDYLLRNQADTVARRWLGLAAEGKSEAMLLFMTRNAVEKLTPASEPGQPMPFFGQILSSALMRQDPLALALAEQRASKEGLQLELTESGVLPNNSPEVFLEYAANSDGVTPLECSVVLKRYSTRVGTEWLVESWAVK